MGDKAKNKIKRKITIRNAYKNGITKIFDETVKDVYKNYGDEEDYETLISSKRSIASQMEKYNLVQEEIIDLVNVDQVEGEILDGINFDEYVNKELVILEKFLEKHRPGEIVSTSNSSSTINNNVKLPKIEIKKFSGDPTTWQTFYDSFECAVNKNEGLSNVQKMSYLMNLLSGPAAETVKGLSISNDNYELCMNLLKERYGNEQIIISTHMNNLLSLNAVKHISDVKGLRKLVDLVKSQVRGLEALGIDPKNYGPLLIPVVLSKIPDEIKLIITRKFDKNIWDAPLILETLESELQAREKLNVIRHETEREQRNQFSSGSTLGVNSNVKNRTCIFCEGEHKPQNCKIIPEIPKRKEFVKNSGRCFLCLRKGHVGRQCSAKFTCFKCNKRHHVAICESETSDTDENKKKPPVEPSVDGSNLHVVCDKNNVLLQTAKASISSTDEKNTANLRIMFDLGSQLSYISPRAAEILKLKSKNAREINIKTFGENQTVKRLNEVEICVKTERENIYLSVFVSEICKPLTGQKIEVAVHKYPYLQGLKLADSNRDNKQLNVDILIGADHYWQFFNNTVIRGNSGGPVAMGSKLGFVLSGPIHEDVNGHTAMIASTHALKIQNDILSENEVLSTAVNKFWSLESVGISPDETSVYEKFNDEIKFVDNRYQVKLPFKEYHENLPSNYEQSVARLKGQFNRFKRDKNLLMEVNTIIKEQESAGIIERVVNNDVENQHYLPHRPVIRDDKTTTKVRVVFDASSHDKRGASLNECLCTGPSLVPSLFGVLLRFRAHNIAMTSDIEKAFLQIAIDPNHRDYLRFIWFDDVENFNSSNFEANKLIEYRLCRVPFGATCSPFLLSATLIRHLSQFAESSPELVEKISDSLHVDDLISGCDNETDTLAFYSDCKNKLSKGCFNLRKFNSNSKYIELLVNENESSEYKYEQFTKVLGIVWDKVNDKLVFDPAEILEKIKLPVTKRNVMHLIASIYDPLGLLNPIVVQMKLFFQKLCVSKIEWDDVLSRDLLKQWNCIIESLKTSPVFTVDRNYGYKDVNDPYKSIQLHGFADASSGAYGCCVYVRFEHLSGKVRTQLICSKSRIKPLSNVTIPRLELLGTLLLARLMTTVKNELNSVYNISNIFFWTDSSIAFSWITNNKEYKTFVQNRVTEIKHLSKIGEWKLIASKDNPADIISRGVPLSELCDNDKWLKGPSFLNLTEAFWPNLQPGSKFITEVQVEEKTNMSSARLSSTVGTTNVSSESSCMLRAISKVIDIRKYNSLSKLVRVTAWVLRFINNIKKKIETKEELNNGILTNTTEEELNNRVLPEEWLSAEELCNAKLLWIRDAQDVAKKHGSFKEWQNSLQLFVDENNLVRCRGRLDKAPIPFECKYPLLLSTDSYFAYLVVLDSHNNVAHNKVKATLNDLRKTFWIPKGRNFVKRILKNCWLCKRIEGPTFHYPNPPCLPESRLKSDRAFSNVGIDYAGPVFVKNIYGDNKDMFKAWIALITCASTRAVYLDLVVDLSGRKCIEVLKRFISRFGAPDVIISDNGKAFISEENQNFASSRNITWKFNLQAAPWQGGFFERLIKSVKRCLKKLLMNARLTFSEFLTLLVEIEMVINNRPLTYVYDEITTPPLTPNHLIYGRSLSSYGSGTKDHEELDSDKANVRTKYITNLLAQFWKSWKEEYLLELREHQRRKKNVDDCLLSKDDVVLVMNEQQPRCQWRIGRVQEIVKSNDGKTRAAKVVTVTDQGRMSTLRRPINKLVPLELHSESVNTDDSMNEIKLTFIDEMKDVQLF